MEGYFADSKQTNKKNNTVSYCVVCWVPELMYKGTREGNEFPRNNKMKGKKAELLFTAEVIC